MRNALKHRALRDLAQTDVCGTSRHRIRGFFPLVMASSIALSALSTQAQEYCLSPVEGGEPRLAVEEKQPYRIATDPRIVPGLSGLIVKASNRHELYKFDGKRLTLIEDDFPHVWGFAYPHGIHTAPDGEAYGFGSRPRAIFHHHGSSSGWRAIEQTRDYERAFFDQGSGAVFVALPDVADVQLIEGGKLIGPASLPNTDGAPAKSVRMIPEIAAALALTGPLRSTPSHSEAIWVRQSHDVWRKIAIDLPEQRRLLDTFEDAEIEVTDDLLRVFPANSAFAPIFFRIEQGALTYAGSAPSGDWTYHSASQTWIGWNGQHVQPAAVEPTPPRAFVLGSDAVEAQIIPSLSPTGDISGDKRFYSPQAFVLDENMPALVSAEDGLMALARTSFGMPPDLSYEHIGRLPKVWSSGGRNLIQSEKGVFILNEDLSVRRIGNFPVEEPWRHQTSIHHIDAWKAYVIVDRASGKVFLSPDLQDFIEVASTEQMASFVGVSPEPVSVLLVGETRLHALAKCEG